MFFTIHNTVSGALLDITQAMPDAVSPEYTISGFDMPVPDLYYYQWDSVTKNFVQKTDLSKTMTVYEFLNRFTASERIAIKTEAKVNPALSDFMDMLNSASFVDSKEPAVYGGLYYLALLGLITQARIIEILR